MWKFIGEKEFVPGVPARDLSDEEVDRRGVRHLVELSPLYQFVEPEPEAPKSKKEKK